MTSLPPDISTALEQLQAGTLSADELTGASLQAIEQLNPLLNAFITVGKVNRETSKQVNKDDLSTSLPVYLTGIPIAIKDLYETAGVRTTAGTTFFKDYIPEADSAVVEKLKAAGFSR